MIRVFFLLIQFLLFHEVFGQRDFEGYIDYEVRDPFRSRLHVENNTDNVDTVKPELARIYFSPGRIKMDSKGSDGKQLTVIVLLDSGKTYTWENGDMQYKVRKMEENQPLPEVGSEIISGYRASPDIVERGMAILPGDRSIFWFADSLFFHVPEKYRDNDDLIMIRRHRIMLKGWIFSKRYISPDREDLDTSIIIAKSIQWQENDPGIFRLPTNLVADTIYNSPIEIEKAPEAVTAPPPPPPPNPKKPVKKTKTARKEMEKTDDNQ